MRIRLTMSALVLLLASGMAADEAAPTPVKEPREALERIQSIVGGWRGVGQVQRNSSKGAWKETAEWVWDLKRSPPSLKITVTDGKHLKTADLSFDIEQQVYVFKSESPDGEKLEYRGKLEKERLSLIAVRENSDEEKLTLSFLNSKRTTLLFEKKAAASTNYQRVAEVGYTREGTRLAVEGVSGKECVVTGGEGTIQVSHNGKKYWVCCTGCVAAFEEDPEGILKEYAARVAERNKKP